VLAVEVGVVGLATAVGVIFGVRQQRAGQNAAHALTSMLLLVIPALLLVAAAVSLWPHSAGGLYWVTASVAMGFAAATANAWVLLVEIKR
jgi:hypothetical protein